MRYLQSYEVIELLTKHLQVLYDHTRADGTFNCKLGGLHEAASAIVELQYSKQPRTTQWWVMLRRNPDGGWECLGFADEMDEELQEAWEEELPPFEVILPIPDPSDERLGEWEGF